MIKLTIGMPTYFDYKGMTMTVATIWEYFDRPDLEVLVVDNTNDENFQETQKRQIDIINNPRYRYISFPDQKGPAETKNKVFEHATGEYVLCIDSHVLLGDGVIERLFDFLNNLEGTDTLNLYSGPLKRFDGSLASHFQNVWRNQMQGIWGTDSEFLDQDQPKEFWAQGCGLMLAKREEWLGFSPHFHGFGGEEGYIHEKYRRAGRKYLCLPWLKWWHCFDDPTQKRSDLTTYSKMRNYVLARQEFGEPYDDVFNHFVSTKKPDGSDYTREELIDHLEVEHSVDRLMLEPLSTETLHEVHQQRKVPKEDWNWLIQDPINRPQSMPNPSIEIFDRFRTAEKNDLSEHFAALKVYAEKVDSVLDISRRPNSAIALSAGLPKTLKSLAFESNPAHLSELLTYTDFSLENIGLFEDVKSRVENWPEEDKIDLVFFKPPHEVKDLGAFFNKLSTIASQYIIVHDTKEEYKPELVEYVKDLLRSGQWFVHHHSNNQWGLTVLAKTKP